MNFQQPTRSNNISTFSDQFSDNSIETYVFKHSKYKKTKTETNIMYSGDIYVIIMMIQCIFFLSHVFNP